MPGISETPNAARQVSDAPSPRRLLSSQTVYEGRIWDVVSDSFQLSDGSDTLVRDYIAHPGAVAVLPMNDAGEVLLIEGRRPVWTEQLKARFARTMPDVADRVRFLPPMPNPRFLQLSAHADVLLDTLHFGGGNTSYEGLACGTPIVTLPSSSSCRNVCEPRLSLSR